jgi:serine/threonine protein kinase
MEMTPEDWNKVKALFESVLTLEPSGRAFFLKRNCPEDGLRQEVEKLVANYHEAGQFLSDPAISPHIAKARPTPGGRTADESADFETGSGVLVATAPGSEEDVMVGRRLGVYKLMRRVGQGGMAGVYLAVRTDGEFRQQVAIKLVRAGLDSNEVLSRFRNERQTLSGLDHPNIVKLLDGGSTAERTPYLVMDYVEGTPIDEYCDRHKLSIEERLHLFGKVCEAVEYAHQKRVIHRDLKPSNILVTADGVPKLLDFGIAKVLSAQSSDEALRLTHTGTRCMTPAYASPEQVRGKSPTFATDIYSLGVLLYELLTGHRPYRLKEHTPVEIERAICEQEPEAPSTAVSRVESETSEDGTVVTKTPQLVSQMREGQPEKLRRRLQGDLDNILLKALQKESERRYGSVQEFSEDIARHLEDKPVKARANTLQYRTRKLLRRRKTEMVALVLLLVLAGGWGYSLWRQGWRQKPSQPANPKAMEYLLKGQSHAKESGEVLFHKSGSMKQSKKEFAEAISYFDRAIQEDPNYVPAYLALANATLGDTNADLARKGQAALVKALALDENNAETHLLKARSFGIYGSDETENHYKKALQLRPEWPEAHECYAEWLDDLGRFEDGMKEHQKAQALDPNGDYLSESPLMPLAERLERKRKFMLINYGVGHDYWTRGGMEYELGQYAEAVKDWASLARGYGWNEDADAIERAYATGGPQALIREEMKIFDEIAKHRFFLKNMLIDVHRYAGDREGALDWLETAATECPNRSYLCNSGVFLKLRSDRGWDPYRSDPRFQRITRQLNLAP